MIFNLSASIEPSFISDSNTSSGVIIEEEAIRNCPRLTVAEAKTRKNFDLRKNLGYGQMSV